MPIIVIEKLDLMSPYGFKLVHFDVSRPLCLWTKSSEECEFKNFIWQS